MAGVHQSSPVFRFCDGRGAPKVRTRIEQYRAYWTWTEDMAWAGHLHMTGSRQACGHTLHTDRARQHVTEWSWPHQQRGQMLSGEGHF